MNATKRWLYFVMEGQMVERFHGRPLMKPVTDAQHQHGVALLCWRLMDEKPSANLLMAALTHDMAEQAAGDVPAPTKWKLTISDKFDAYEAEVLDSAGFQFQLADEELTILKTADYMEGMISCIRERFYGNRYVNLAYWKWYDAVSGWPYVSDTCSDLLAAIHSIWCWADSGEPPTYDVFKENV